MKFIAAMVLGMFVSSAAIACIPSVESSVKLVAHRMHKSAKVLWNG